MLRSWLRVAALAAALALFPLTAFAGEALTQPQADALMQAQAGAARALLIGVDSFVSKPSTYPSSYNNVEAMRVMFLAALDPPQVTVAPEGGVTTVDAFTRLIQDTFAMAGDNDVSYLYMSTHGVYDPQSGEPPKLLLSDGTTEEGLTPCELEQAFQGIRGKKVLILDACNSGAFIGKGLAKQPDDLHFLCDDFKVLCSSGALEESWYWSAGEGEGVAQTRQGAFYFTQALTQGLSASSGYPADPNRDGSVTLSELYDYLLLSHAASTPQVYPQTDDLVVFRYDAGAPLPTGKQRAPITDVTFSGTVLSQASRQITIEFIAMRPVRVAYQIVYQRSGKWEFDSAQLIYDEAERFTAFGDQPGAISAGRKVRTLTLGDLPEGSYGYVLVQLVTIDQGQLTVHGGRVICVPPIRGDMQLSVRVPQFFSPAGGRELALFIGHEYPCTLSVAIVDEDDRVVRRLCHRRGTRPMQLIPMGTVLYWDGALKNGSPAAPGVYRVRAQAMMNDTTVTVLSSTFTLE